MAPSKKKPKTKEQKLRAKPANYFSPKRQATRAAYKAAIAEVVPKVLPPPKDAEPTFNNTYTTKLGEDLRSLVIMGVSMKKISYMPNMPQYWVLASWAADEAHPFSAIYEAAKKIKIAMIEEDIMDIADTPEPMAKTVKRTVNDRWGQADIVETVTFDDPRHRQIRINARQFTLGHYAPKKHGKQATEGEGDNKGLQELLTDMRTISAKLDGGSSETK